MPTRTGGKQSTSQIGPTHRQPKGTKAIKQRKQKRLAKKAENAANSRQNA